MLVLPTDCLHGGSPWEELRSHSPRTLMHDIWLRGLVNFISLGIVIIGNSLSTKCTYHVEESRVLIPPGGLCIQSLQERWPMNECKASQWVNVIKIFFHEDSYPPITGQLVWCQPRLVSKYSTWCSVLNRIHYHSKDELWGSGVWIDEKDVRHDSFAWIGILFIGEPFDRTVGVGRPLWFSQLTSSTRRIQFGWQDSE